MGFCQVAKILVAGLERLQTVGPEEGSNISSARLAGMMYPFCLVLSCLACQALPVVYALQGQVLACRPWGRQVVTCTLTAKTQAWDACRAGVTELLSADSESDADVSALSRRPGLLALRPNTLLSWPCPPRGPPGWHEHQARSA